MFKSRRKPVDHPEPEENPSQDRTGRFPEDAELRSHGFRIYKRPKHGPAWWELQGVLYD